jgi:F420-0:gamma-glutamyl ligase
MEISNFLEKTMSQPRIQASIQPAEQVSRRRLFVGASTVGAMAAAATLVPGIGADNTPAPVVKIVPLKGGGYTLSEHVKQYYKTTLI